MITEEILHIAMEQSAEDINCKTEDFLKNQNVIVPFRLGKKHEIIPKCRCMDKNPSNGIFLSPLHPARR